ncbi:acyltransferase domain-containing protein [Kribbella sp. NPDC051620]|uniref:acyltransferase domain-containing protein n=1 Tax=Kribbella sp. NPDC051620 TaxID=3364120 RepID=UPI0037A8F616
MAISELDLRRFLVDRVARACELPPADVDADRLLEQYGVASRDAVAVTGELEEVLGRRLEPSSVWRYPTINQLIRGLLSPAAPDGVPISSPDALSGSELAVIGLARRSLKSTASGQTLREVIWEALEHAGMPPRDLDGASLSTAMSDLRTGVVEFAVAVLDGPACQVVVLKRLADAERDHDQVLALCTDPQGEPSGDFFEAVLTADRGLTPDLLPFPVGAAISCPEAVVRRTHPAARTPSTGPTRLLLSDTSLDAIRTHAGQLATYLRTNPATSTADLAHTLARRLPRGPLRAAITGRHPADLTAALTSLAQATPHPTNFAAEALPTPPQPVWVFPSQSSSPTGLRELAESVPGFLGVLVELDALMVWAAGVSLREAVRTDVVAVGDELPVGFAVQVGLALVWREYGVVPAAIVAEGCGEVAAAVVAGALTATEGARVIAALARTPDQLGPMLADLAPAEVRLPFYSSTSTDATPFGAEYWIATTKPSTSIDALLDRAADDGHQRYIELTADALAFHTQLAMLEVLGLPITPPPGRVTDVPVAPWPGS